jgi:HNH endonuclease
MTSKPIGVAKRDCGAADERRNWGCIVRYMMRSEAVQWTVRDGASERDWIRAHTALTRLARERAAADAEEGRWLLLAWRANVHAHLGHGSFSEYAERLFGYSARATREKLRVAEALEQLPQSGRALEQGALSWCAARELTRVVTPDTEAAWLEAAHGKTTRELERMVAGRQRGDTPPRPTDPDPPHPRVLRFEVSPDTYATFREAMQSLRRAAGGPLNDDALLSEMARRVLGAPTDSGCSGYRITYERCPACGQGAQVSGGERIPVDAEIIDMAACDGEHLPASSSSPMSAANENATGGDTPVTHVGRPKRARRAIPPALRRAVLARDRGCCRVPGCTNTHFVDVHHIRPRSEGGTNTIENLITICTAHHRAAHRGELIIEPTASGLSFRHADGTPYGEPVNATDIDDHAKVFSALRHLGFRERDVHAVLSDIRSDENLRCAPLDQLLREALCRIRPRA